VLPREGLGSHLASLLGVYASLRPSHPSFAALTTGQGLALIRKQKPSHSQCEGEANQEKKPRTKRGGESLEGVPRGAA
jgi:hypothetical protein